MREITISAKIIIGISGAPRPNAQDGKAAISHYGVLLASQSPVHTMKPGAISASI